MDWTNASIYAIKYLQRKLGNSSVRLTKRPKKKCIEAALEEMQLMMIAISFNTDK